MPILQRNTGPDLFYEIDDFTDPWKDAPFIFLQHGYGRSTKFWYRWIPYLARFYKVVRADLRGLGQSSKDFNLREGITSDAYVLDVGAILDAIGTKSVHFCGESMGGIIGMMFAAEFPQKVRSLSVVSSPIFLNKSTQERAKFGFESWEEALRKLGSAGYAKAKNTADRFSADTDPGLMDWFADQQGKSDVEVLIEMQKYASNVNATSCLSRIAAPVFAIYPSAGPLTTPEQEELLRKHVRNLRLVHLQSQTHSLHCTQAATCATHVLHFIAQVDGISCHE